MSNSTRDVTTVLDRIKDLNSIKDLSKYGKEFQLKLISLIIHDKVFSFSIVPILKEEYFADVYIRTVYKHVVDYMNEYHVCPTLDNVKILLELSGAKMAVYGKILKSIKDIKLDDRDFVIKNARQFCFSRYALREHEIIKQHLIAGEFEQAKARSIESFRFSGDNQTKIYSLKSDYNKLFDEEQQHQPIPTPFKTFNDNMKGGPGKGNLMILVAESNFGKCFAPGTKVYMSDMTLSNIEDIKVGDKVMGWDGKERTVKSIHSGEDDMYRVDQNNGESYIVNSRHELCIINSKDVINKDNVQLMNPVQYIERMRPNPIGYNKKTNWNRKWQLNNRGFKSPGIEFKELEINIDPYFLGLWLGDGDKNRPYIFGKDLEVKKYLIEYAKDINLYIYETKDKRNNCYSWALSSEDNYNYLTDNLRRYNLLGNKHIPDIYLKNSKENRLKLLAGLIDTDGGLGKTRTSVEITQKSDILANQILFLCRSLGLRASLKKKEGRINGEVKGIYNRIIISGKELVNVPTKISRKKIIGLKTKKDELKTKISVTPVGKGKYFGFEIEEEDKMFLLQDFTVVHNTNALIAFSRHANALNKNVVFFSFEIGGIDMLRRHIAGLTDIKQEDIRYHKDAIEARLKTDGLGEFVLIEERATSARIAVIKNHLEYLKSTGFFADMICVDALNQLKLPKNIRYENDNQRFEYLAEELRDLANDEELPVLTVMQTNRQGFGSDINGIQQIGKAIEPFQVADVLITFSQTPEEEREKRCKALLLKNRLGKKYILLECYYDPNKCVFDEIGVINELMLLDNDKKKDVIKKANDIRQKIKSGEFDKK